MDDDNGEPTDTFFSHVKDWKNNLKEVGRRAKKIWNKGNQKN